MSDYVIIFIVMSLAFMVVTLAVALAREKERSSFRNLIIGVYYLRYGPLEKGDVEKAIGAK